jgi:hypothetical protein
MRRYEDAVTDYTSNHPANNNNYLRQKMADIGKLLTLSKTIARKARLLIPRSPNRSSKTGTGYSAEGIAVDTEWKNAPPYTPNSAISRILPKKLSRS